MPRLVKVRVSQFFDAPSVVRRVDRAARRVLAGAGGFVRTVARRSIRPSKTAFSKPGEPPKSKTKILRNSILFASDGDRSVVIGPRSGVGRANDNAAETLEFGRTVTRKKGRVVVHKRALRASARSQLIPGRDERGRFTLAPRDHDAPRLVKGTKDLYAVLMPARRVYKPRPYMGPALDKGSERFPDLFAGQVRK